MIPKPVRILLVALALFPAAVRAARAAGTEATAVLAPRLSPHLAPHKALYEIRMVSKKSSSRILNVSGRMYYEWKPSCDAWLTNHRFNLDYEYTDGPPLQISSDFSTYEPFDGKSFDYSSRRRRDGELYQELRGHAERAADGTAAAVYTMPQGLRFDMTESTLFPMAHTLGLLEKMKEGQAFFSAPVFDGSDEDGPVEINSFIGKPAPAPDAALLKNPNIDAKLLESPARAVRMAFFPLGQSSPDAEYEMDLVFHENGIISDMQVAYSDFSVTQKLVALEKLAPDACDPAQPPEKK